MPDFKAMDAGHVRAIEAMQAGNRPDLLDVLRGGNAQLELAAKRHLQKLGLEAVALNPVTQYYVAIGLGELHRHFIEKVPLLVPYKDTAAVLAPGQGGDFDADAEAEDTLTTLDMPPMWHRDP